MTFLRILSHKKVMSGKSIGIVLITASLLASCKKSSNELTPITEYFAFNKSYSWTYQYTGFGDTSTFFMDFDLSQLSENEEVGLLEIYGLEFSDVLAVVSAEEGMCVNLLGISIEEAKAKINSLEVDCAVFLKYPVQSGEDYKYTYQDEVKTYEYDISVTSETMVVEAGTFDVYKYEFKSGNPSNPNIAVLYFNPNTGIIKLNPELGPNPESSPGFSLTEVN